MSRQFMMILLCSIAGIAVFPGSLQVAFSQPPQVVSVSPGQNQIAATVHAQITATFSVPIVPSTITSLSFSIFGERSGYMAGTLAYDTTERRASYTPTTAFVAGERVTAFLSRSVKSQNGDSLRGYTWTFRIPSARRSEFRFANTVVYSGGGRIMQSVDMNRDGSPDIVSSSGVIRLNNGSGTFNTLWTLPGADPFFRIAVDDFNRDGIMDVVYNGNGLRIALSGGNGSFNLQSRPWWFIDCITGDFNADGFPDIAGLTTHGDTWGISFNNGSGLFLDTVVIGRVQGILTAMEVFDVDNDGDLDILCAGFPINANSQDGIAVWKGNGRGGFDSLRVYPSNVVFRFPEQLYSSDFSNNGFADIAVFGYAGHVSLNTNGTFGIDTASTRRFWPGEFPGAMTGGDFNGDGWIDLMMSGYRNILDTAATTYYAIIPNCSGVFRGCFPLPGFSSDTLGHYYLATSNQAVDLDNDGDLDMVHSYGGFAASPLIYVNINTNPLVSVREEPELPRGFHVDQNYPNPFNSGTIIRYRVPTAQRIRIQVYDTFGKEVKQLHNAVVAPGEHVIRWNGTNEDLSRVASGVYFIRFLSSNSTKVLKVLHLK